MATAKPLTAEERAQLETLQKRDAEVARAERETARQESLAKLAPVAEVVGGDAWPAMIEKLRTAIATVGDADAVGRIQRLLQIMENDGNFLRSRIETLSTPEAEPFAPVPAAP